MEHISFSAFRKGKRLKQSVHYFRQLAGKITHLSVDDNGVAGSFYGIALWQYR